MRAIQFSEYGPGEVLRLVETEMPPAGKGQVRVKVAAAGVNPADYKWREGMFREVVPVPLPHTLGYDIAGTIDAVGAGVEGFAVGDRVFAMLDPFSKGGYAEFAVADVSWLAKVPADLDLDLAATLPTSALTGLQMIEEHVRPQSGETLLVTGAVGAVGRFAVHAANRLGVRVIAAVRASQRDLALSLGASEAIVLGNEIPAGLSFDHVADTVGGGDVAALCRLVRPGGRILTAATTPIDPQGLVATPTFFAVHPDGAGLARIGDLVANGAVTVAPARALPLAEAAEAHRLVEAGGLGEKIILRT